jgi:hypothetical protein
MDASEQSPSERTFRVGLWAKTGMYLREDDPLTLRNLPIESGTVELEFSTYREFPDGFTAPVAYGLYVVVEGTSTSLGQAIQDFGNTARGLTALLSVVANATIGEPTAYIALETTADSTSREFFTQNLETGEWPMGPGRLVTADLFPPLVEAFFTHNDQDRFHRAVVQYHHALQVWEPGNEIAALNHIWIGMEALTRLVRTKLEAQHGLTSQELAKKYLPNVKPICDGTIDLNKLGGEIRLRHLFKGDAETHRWAKQASDSYEHSYDPLWKVRDRAVRAVEASLGYLRSAILECSGVNTEYLDMLLGEYFAHPHTNQVHIGLRGDLTGPATDLNRIDPFPEIQLTHEPVQFGVDVIGDARVVFKTGIRAEDLPNGVEFHPDRPEIVALLGTADGTELIVSESQEDLTVADNLLDWESEVRSGREVMSITSAGLIGVPISAQSVEVVSVDSKHEYRVVHMNGEAARLSQERLTRIFIKYQSELAEDGWELLCIIPSRHDESLTLICRRDALAADSST